MPHVSQPPTFADALAVRAAEPDAVVIAGGTGVMPRRNGTPAAEALLDLSRVAGFRDAERDGATLRLGAGVTYTQVIERHAALLPGLAAASQTVASRQIRNRATLAGALVIADPSADALAALAASDAEVALQGPGGPRRVTVERFVRAPGVPDLAPDELVAALHVPVADGPVAYAKVGARNAMARAVCGVAVALHPARRAAGVAVVGTGATAVRARAAEALLAERADWGAGRPPGPELLDAFTTLVRDGLGEVAGDARGSADHRRHVAGVLARRLLLRAWGELDIAQAA